MKKVQKLITGMLLCLPVVAVAQAPRYVLEGTVNHLSAPATMYLNHYQNKVTTIDSCVLHNGHYHFEGNYEPDQQTHLGLSFSGQGWHALYRSKEIYLERGKMEVNSTDSLSNVQFVHSPFNEALQKVGDTTLALYYRYRDTDTAYYQHELDRLLRAFLIRFSTSPAALTHLKEHGTFWGNDVVAEPYFNLLAPQVKESPAGKAYAQKIAIEKKLAIGNTLADFTLPDTSGKSVSLTDFRGKYVLVDFWASWCGPCRAENPNVVAAYNHYKDKGFTVLAVSLDYPRQKAAWLNAIHHDQLPWTQVSDLQGWKSAPVQQFGISFVPRNFLVGPDGKILGQNLRGAALEQQLKSLLDK